MQRGASADKRTAPPGVFETIAIAMSALLVQPLPVALPVAVDLYLWAGPRLSPAALLEPLRWLAAQDTANAGLVEQVEQLEGLARTGDLATIVGWFVPSLLAVAGQADRFAPWQRPSIDLANVGLTLALAAGLILAGVAIAMTFTVMLGRVVRGVSPVGDRFARAAGLAAIRYLGFLALVLAVALAVVVPAAIAGAVLLLFGLDLLPLLVVAGAAGSIVAYVVFAFVGEAIVLAEVGPLRAIALSFGVVRRNPWATLGLLLVLVTVSAILPRLVGSWTTTAPGLAAAIAAYAFVATGLALARMQFFYDRLRRWRADLIPQPVASSQRPEARI